MTETYGDKMALLCYIYWSQVFVTENINNKHRTLYKEIGLLPCLKLTAWRPNPWKWLIERVWGSLKQDTVNRAWWAVVVRAGKRIQQTGVQRSDGNTGDWVLHFKSFLLCARKEHFYIFPRLHGRVTPRLNRANCKAAQSVGYGKGFVVCFWPGWAKTERFTKVSLWPERQSVNSWSRKAWLWKKLASPGGANYSAWAGLRRLLCILSNSEGSPPAWSPKT